MVIKKGHELFTAVKLLDSKGYEIPWAFYFNTKSKLVKVYVRTKPDRTVPRFIVDKNKRVRTAAFTLKNAKLIDKTTGMEIKY